MVGGQADDGSSQANEATLHSTARISNGCVAARGDGALRLPHLAMVCLRRQRVLLDQQVDERPLRTPSVESAVSMFAAVAQLRGPGANHADQVARSRERLGRLRQARSAQARSASSAPLPCQLQVQARLSLRRAPAPPQARQFCASRTACLLGCAAWRATATATLAPAWRRASAGLRRVARRCARDAHGRRCARGRAPQADACKELGASSSWGAAAAVADGGGQLPRSGSWGGGE